MRQALHILRKDARYLWREIGMFLVLNWLFAWKDPMWAEVLVTVTAVYLIARCIHAEPIPGDTQFWVTRPYDWKSLLGAKLLFIAGFVNVPLFMARAFIVSTKGFPLSDWLGPLVWSQFVILISVCLPVAALAALTVDILPFISSIILLLALGFSIPLILAGRIPYIRPSVRTLVEPWPEGFQWIRDTVFFTVVILAAIYIVGAQYKTRRTATSRVTGSILLALAMAGALIISPADAIELQARFSPRFDSSNLQVAVDTAPRKFGIGRPQQTQISIPLTVTGLPENVEAQPDNLAIKIIGKNGETLDLSAIPNRSVTDSGLLLDTVFFIDSEFFKNYATQDASLKGSLYLTLFGNPQSQEFVFAHDPVNVGNGVQCFIEPVTSQLHCRSAFRWPGLQIYAKVRNDTESLWPLISYSPFPSGIELSIIEEHWASGPPPHDPRATIIMKEPLAHIRKDFAADSFRLPEFVAPPQRLKN